MSNMTRRQFLAALKKQGWEKVTPHTWRHPNGTLFQPDRYTPEKGILWRWYARQNALPAAIEGEGLREIK